MKKSGYLPALLAVMMVLCVTVGTALAYFTTWTSTTAKKDMELKPDTTIVETQADENQKKMTVTNNGNAPCFIRLMVYANDQVTNLAIEGDAVTSGSYWYYTPMLETGDSVELTITFDLPDTAAEGDTLNIAVVYESVAALYDENTDSYYADWSLAATPASGG